MSRMTRLVPSTVLAVAALAFVAPVSQARPLIAQSGGVEYANPSVQSTQDVNYGKSADSATVTTGDKPLANPVQLPQTLGVGVMHASTVHVPIDKIPTTPVAVPDSSGNGFDWTAAAIGAGVSGILMLMLASGAGFRRRGGLAA